MKSRKVIVHLELKTDLPIKFLKNKDEWAKFIKDNFLGANEVHQITAHVIKESK